MRPFGLIDDAAAALRFLSRLPIPARAGEDAHAAPDLDRIGAAFPLAGFAIGAIGALALVAAGGAGLPPLAAAFMALGATILATGALHEDGLADVADGFGGGRTRERKLEIMRDPRVGSFGVVALIVVLGVEAALLADLAARHGYLAAGFALIAVAALSRAALLWPLHALAPARADGASVAAGRPSRASVERAALVAALVAGLVLVPAAGVWPFLLACGGAALGAVLATALARRHIDGQTGDVAGATQKLAALLALALFVGALG